jgi:hypothetical protein
MSQNFKENLKLQHYRTKDAAMSQNLQILMHMCIYVSIYLSLSIYLPIYLWIMYKHREMTSFFHQNGPKSMPYQCNEQLQQ